MRNFIIGSLIFVPIVTVFIYFYIRLFVTKVAKPVPPIALPTRRADLLRMRHELNSKLTDLADAKEAAEIQRRIDAVDKQLDAVDDGTVKDAPDATDTRA